MWILAYAQLHTNVSFTMQRQGTAQSLQTLVASSTKTTSTLDLPVKQDVEYFAIIPCFSKS
jgi:hypothetical protein